MSTALNSLKVEIYSLDERWIVPFWSPITNREMEMEQSRLQPREYNSTFIPYAVNINTDAWEY